LQLSLDFYFLALALAGADPEILAGWFQGGASGSWSQWGSGGGVPEANNF